MEWIAKLNEAVNYIEDNLTSEISYEKAAQIACCSTFLFKECFPKSPMSRFLNTSGGEELPWQLSIIDLFPYKSN